MQPLVLLRKRILPVGMITLDGSSVSDSNELFLPAATSRINDRQSPSAPFAAAAASAAAYGGDLTNYIYIP